MKVLVTGGGGFLGSHVVERFRAAGHDPFVARRREYDLTAWDDAARLFADAKPELVVHLAAEVGGIGANRANPGRYWYANLMMGAHVLEQSRVDRRREARRRRNGLRVPEVHAGALSRGRSLGRLPGGDERAVRRREEGRCSSVPRATGSSTASNAVFLLPANLYGPRDNFDLETSHVIPALIRKMLEGDREVVLWGDGSPTREFLYVDDGADAFVLAAEHYEDAAPVNLGTGVEISIRDLAETIAELTGFAGRIVWDESMPNGQPRRALDASQARGRFGFRRRRRFATARADDRVVSRAGACGSLAARSGQFRPSQRPWCSSSCNCSLRPGSGTARGGTERRETRPSPPCCSRSRWCSSMRSPSSSPAGRRRSSQASSSSRGRS